MKRSAFSYKAGNSFLHRMPAWLKILFVPAASIAVFSLPACFSAALIAFQFLLASLLRFSLREQLRDLKFTLYLAVFLYFTGMAGFFCAGFLGGGLGLVPALRLSAERAFGNSATALMLMKLLCVMQTSSLVFKTTTSLEMRGGVAAIEAAVRRLLRLGDGSSATDLVSFTFYFIPLVFRIWGQLETAWRARQGKASPRMFMALLPALFSVGMKSAYNAARAVMARRQEFSGAPETAHRGAAVQDGEKYRDMPSRTL